MKPSKINQNFRNSIESINTETDKKKLQYSVLEC